MSLVSIVIATYNRAPFLQKAVQSALAQSHFNIEVVVSDDASPDDSLAVLGAIADPRLRVLAQPKNLGVWRNWTAALGMARGDFVVFLGDDDTLSPTFASDHLEAFDADPGLSAVFCALDSFDPNGTLLGAFPPPFPVGRRAPSSALVRKLFSGQVYAGAGMFRRELAVEIWNKTEPDGMVADWGLLLRTAMRENTWVSSCPNAVYGKIASPDQLSRRFIEVTTLMAEVCERTGRLSKDRKLKGELMLQAAWERVTLARHFAAFGDMKKCRAALWRCVSDVPTFRNAWTQLILSYLRPARLETSAREQRGMSVMQNKIV